MIWDTRKLSSQIISLILKRSKRKQAILDVIKRKENLPENLSIAHQIKLLKQQLSMLTAREMEIKMSYAKQKNFELANKPGKWLACKLRKEKEKEMILKLEERDTVLMDNAVIYKKHFLTIILICVKDMIFLWKIDEYLENKDLARLTEKQKQVMFP